MTDKANTPNLKDILNKGLKVSGSEIPDGTYPATLAGYSEPWWQDQTASKFYKQGDPQTKLMMKAQFAIWVKTPKGAEKLEPVEMMLNVPNGKAHIKSGVYKFIKALLNGDPELIDKDGNFSDRVNLAMLIGRSATLSVKTNEKGFAQVESLQSPIDGPKYPTAEEAKALSFDADGGDAPF